MSKLEYKHLDLSGASLVQRRHRRQVTPPGMWSVTNLISSPSDNVISMRPDFQQIPESLIAMSGYENGVITQTLDPTLDILNSTAGIFGSSRTVFFGTYMPISYLDGEWKIGSDSYAGIGGAGTATATSGSYDVDFATVDDMRRTSWRGQLLEINDDGRYYVVEEAIDADTLRLKSPTEAAYTADSFKLYYNHNPYRAWNTKLNIQTGRTSTASAIIYSAPTFLDNFSAADISGPFYTNVTEAELFYEFMLFDASSSSEFNSSHQNNEMLNRMATNGVIWLHVNFAGGTPRSENLWSTTQDIMADETWTSYDFDRSVWTYPRPNGDDVLTGIAPYGMVRNSVRGLLGYGRAGFDSASQGSWTGACVFWSTNNGATWTMVIDEDYIDDTAEYTCVGAWDDNTTLTAVFLEDNEFVDVRYSTNSGSTWNDSNVMTAGATSYGGSLETRLKSLGSSGNNKFVLLNVDISTGQDGFWYSTDGQTFTEKSVTGAGDLNTSNAVLVTDIVYNNADGGTASWWISYVENVAPNNPPKFAKADTTIDGSYAEETVGNFAERSTADGTHLFYDTYKSRIITSDSMSFNGIQYVYISDDQGANWSEYPVFVASQPSASIQWDFSGSIIAGSMGTSRPLPNGSASFDDHIVLYRNTAVDYDVSEFLPLSLSYRATTASNLDGYVVMFGTSEWNSVTNAWDYYPRRIRWSAPGDYSDFSVAAGNGAGTADLKGTGGLLYSIPINGRILVFETGTVGALVPRGDTDDPWDYDTVADNFKILSNPVAVGSAVYVVGFDGLLYSCDGIQEPEELGASFDLTRFRDFDNKSPAWLVYSREFNSLICYYRDSSASSHYAQMINIGTGGVTEIELDGTADTSAKSDQPISVVAVEDASDRRMFVSQHPSPNDPDRLFCYSLSPGDMITGTDHLLNYGATSSDAYRNKWYSTLESGELYITKEGEKASVKHLIAETYTDASIGSNTDTPYLVAEVKSIEDSDYATSGDTEGTATMSTTALTGSGTAWSNTIVVGTAAAGEVGPYTLPCLASQARVYVDSTLLVSGTDYTESGKTITLTTDLGDGEVLYAYWENYPEIKVKVGDFFKSSEGWHRVTAVSTSTAITCDHYLSTGSETVTHYPAWQMDDGHGRVEIGINRLVEGVQIRLYIIPDYNGTEQSTVAKITGLSIGYVPQGRKIVKATGS